MSTGRRPVSEPALTLAHGMHSSEQSKLLFGCVVRGRTAVFTPKSTYFVQPAELS
jgi:hypothetical protein